MGARFEVEGEKDRGRKMMNPVCAYNWETVRNKRGCYRIGLIWIIPMRSDLYDEVGEGGKHHIAAAPNTGCEMILIWKQEKRS